MAEARGIPLLFIAAILGAWTAMRIVQYRIAIVYYVAPLMTADVILEHDDKKWAPVFVKQSCDHKYHKHDDKKWAPVFVKQSCDHKYLKHDDKMGAPVFVTNRATTNFPAYKARPESIRSAVFQKANTIPGVVTAMPVAQTIQHHKVIDLMAFGLQEISNNAPRRDYPASWAISSPREQQPKTRASKRLQIYGYSFWRTQSQNTGLAAAGQYGGSQSGIVAAYKMGDARNNPAILVRTTVSPRQPKSGELALGMRWQPMNKIPVSVTLERRFSQQAPGAYALYAAGGMNRMPLAMNFYLDGYAQIGVLAGKRKDRFFDLSAQAQKPVFAAGPVHLSAGTGIWAGGQKGLSRVDIGPSLQTEIALGDRKLNVSTDYRIRIAGNALPKNGPTITLSVGF